MQGSGCQWAGKMSDLRKKEDLMRRNKEIQLLVLVIMELKFKNILA
jgi:hypothetical protein